MDINSIREWSENAPIDRRGSLNVLAIAWYPRVTVPARGRVPDGFNLAKTYSGLHLPSLYLVVAAGWIYVHEIPWIWIHAARMIYTIFVPLYWAQKLHVAELCFPLQSSSQTQTQSELQFLVRIRVGVGTSRRHRLSRKKGLGAANLAALTMLNLRCWGDKGCNLFYTNTQTKQAKL